MLDFRIATFLQLCETRSYTKAARILGITQPSVTQHIKYLQTQFGCKLFSYEGKTLCLTPEGEYLRRHAEAMTKTAERVKSDLRRMSRRQHSLQFGVPMELGTLMAADIVVGIQEQMQVSQQTGSAATLRRLLDSASIDVLLADKHETSSPQYGCIPVGKVHFGCYMSSALAAKNPTLHQLTGQHLLVREQGSADRTVLEELLEKRGLAISDFASVTESNDPAAIQAMAAAGKGIVFAYATGVAHPELTPVHIPELSAERPLVLLYLKERTAEQGIADFTEEFCSRWKPND